MISHTNTSPALHVVFQSAVTVYFLLDLPVLHVLMLTLCWSYWKVVVELFFLKKKNTRAHFFCKWSLCDFLLLLLPMPRGCCCPVLIPRITKYLLANLLLTVDIHVHEMHQELIYEVGYMWFINVGSRWYLIILIFPLLVLWENISLVQEKSSSFQDSLRKLSMSVISFPPTGLLFA